ncbi:MAG: hypothetical protein CMF68_01200 [Magnetovibrio sp.]|nr:hypothetical protein [Magnetovibrio sp.]
MHSLSRISLTNWYLFDVQDIEIEGSTALIGPTGAGKSAILDALQTALIGTNKNVLKLNASAANVRGGRTVKEYCLGVLDDGGKDVARDRCETILALTFRDTNSKAPTTIGIALRADRDEPREELLCQFIAEGVAFSAIDIAQSVDEKGDFIQHWDDVRDTLKKLTAHTGGRFNEYPTGKSRQFIQDYLTIMRGPSQRPDPRHVQRALMNAVAFRPITDCTEFVRRYLLDDQPLDIERVRESLDVWNSVKQTIERINDQIRALHSSVFGPLLNAAKNHVKRVQSDWTEAHSEHLRLERVQQQDQEKLERLESEQRRLNAIIGYNEKAIDEERSELESLKAAVAQVDQGGQLQILSAQRSNAEKDIERAKKDILQIVDVLNRIASLVGIRECVPLSTHALIDRANTVVRSIGQSPTKEDGVLNNIAVIGDLCGDLAKTELIQNSLHQQCDALGIQVNELRLQLEKLDATITASSEDGAVLSHETRRFRDLLTKAGIRNQALPDVVEISEPAWAYALESLLGHNREAIIVPAERVRDALRLLREHRKEIGRVCRLIRTDRIEASSTEKSPPPGSITNILKTDNKYARAFIDATVGRFVRANDIHELEMLRYGIMEDCRTSAGLTYRVYLDIQPILGKTAAQEALIQAQTERDNLRESWLNEANKLKLLRDGIQQCTFAISYQESEPRSPSDTAAILQSARRVLKDQDELRHSLLSEAASEHLKEIEFINEDIKAREDENRETRILQREIDKNLGAVSEQLKATEQRLNDMADRRARIEDEEMTGIEYELSIKHVDEFAKWPEDRCLDLDALRSKVENQVGMTPEEKRIPFLADLRNESQAQSREASEQYQKSVFNGQNAFFVYRRDYGADDTVTSETSWVQILSIAIRDLHRLETNELRDHEHQAERAYEEMRLALKEDLLLRLHEKLSHMRQRINTLNTAMGKHKFLSRTYRFSWKANPNFAGIRRLSEKVAESPERSADIIAGEGEDEDVRAAMTEFEAYLANDEDTNLLGDYRNYYDFDLVMALDEQRTTTLDEAVGKASGGEGQVPFYVAIGASLRSAYFPGSPPGSSPSGMGLALFDEAFNKIDVANTQQIIKYFESCGLQLLIAAPEAQRPTFLESIDTIVNVNRQQGTDVVYVETEHIGPAAKSALTDANPATQEFEAFKESFERNQANSAAD